MRAGRNEGGENLSPYTNTCLSLREEELREEETTGEHHAVRR